MANALEAVWSSYIIDEQKAHRTAVVGRCDGFEALLSGGVPYLQLDFATLAHDRLHAKVYAHRRGEVVGKRVLAVAKQQRCLANAGAPHQQQFE